MLAGLIGVPLGSYLSTVLSKRYPRCDPIICGSGLVISAPLMAAAMYYVNTVDTALTFTLIFFAELALNLNWAIVADILLVRDREINGKKLSFFLVFSDFLLKNGSEKERNCHTIYVYTHKNNKFMVWFWFVE
jgi:hypothetical protein